MQMAGVRLVSVGRRKIRSLLGFKPSHQEPRSCNPATRRFTKQCATEDITNELDLIWSKCRLAFSYKRKDKVGPNLEDGSGSLCFPDFRYSIVAAQDEDHPEELRWHMTIDMIKDESVLINTSFNEIFTNGFDYLEADFPNTLEIGLFIDRIEELNPVGLRLQYPADCSCCELYLKELGLYVHISPEKFHIRFQQMSSAKELTKKFLQIRAAIYAKGQTDPWIELSAKQETE